MVANDAFTRSIAAIIGLSVHIELQSLKANLSANSNDIDKRIDAIQYCTIKLTGDDGSVWSPIIAYRDGSASFPNLVFMFSGTAAAGNMQTKVADDAKVLMTRLGVRTVVAYDFPIPQKQEPLDMQRFVERASATVWVLDDEQSKPVGVEQEGLSTALWLSDFLDHHEALDAKFVRPRRYDNLDKAPNVVIGESAILNTLRNTSDAILARAKRTVLPSTSSGTLGRSQTYSTMAHSGYIGLSNGHPHSWSARAGHGPVRSAVAHRTVGWALRRVLRK